MVSYIIQIIIFQSLFLLVYEMLLKKETFFSYNRWYLLATSIVSFLLPFLKIEALTLIFPAEALPGVSTIWLPEVFIGEAPAAVSKSVDINSSGEEFEINWWLLAYATGALWSLLSFFRKFQNLKRLFRFRIVAAEENWKIIEVPNSNIACTFYKTVFLGDQLSEAEREQILFHEMVHIKELHSLDLLFFEVLKILFWFNPLVYIYQNRIATLHEFIADAVVVKTAEKKSYYEQLLNSAFNTSNISFINQFFNHSLIKKRIVMLQKSKSTAISKLKFLILLPLMAIMLTYVACSEDPNPANETIVETGDADAAMKAAFWKEIQLMEDSGANQKEISIAFASPGKQNLSREEFYRFQAFMKYMYTKIVETEKAEGNYNEEKSKRFLQALENRTYEDYLNEKKVSVTSLDSDKINAEVADIPFAVVDQVPVFPGCEDLGSNEEKKKCMSKKVQEHVMQNFNTSLGKELGLSGINRVIAIFKISAEGKIIDVRARAPHPDLEAEAIKVISEMPMMIPGEQKGNPVAVSYSLPIVFQVGE